VFGTSVNPISWKCYHYVIISVYWILSLDILQQLRTIEGQGGHVRYVRAKVLISPKRYEMAI